jgi:plastocyanin
MRHRLTWIVAPLVLLACSEHAATTTPVETSSMTVSVEDNRFTPPQLALAAGGTASWAWGGNNQHNVTFDDGAASSTQQRGQYARQFATAGTYRYHCTVHGAAMSGTVEVR